jgi:hypothetical protein
MPTISRPNEHHAHDHLEAVQDPRHPGGGQSGLWIALRQFAGNGDNWTLDYWTRGAIYLWGACLQQGNDPKNGYARTWASQTAFASAKVACGATVIATKDNAESSLRISGPASNLPDHRPFEVTGTGELIIAGGIGNTPLAVSATIGVTATITDNTGVVPARPADSQRTARRFDRRQSHDRLSQIRKCWRGVFRDEPHLDGDGTRGRAVAAAHDCGSLGQERTRTVPKQLKVTSQSGHEHAARSTSTPIAAAGRLEKISAGCS